MLYSASRRQKVGSVSLIAPGQSSSTHYVSSVCGPLLHSFRFTRPRNLFIFNRSHTLVFEPSATHSFPTLCALFQKHRGCTSFLPKTELTPASWLCRCCLALSPHPN